VKIPQGGSLNSSVFTLIEERLRPPRTSSGNAPRTHDWKIHWKTPAV